MNNRTLIQLRDPARAHLNDAIAQFLASGGAISKLSHTERAEYKPLSFNNTATFSQAANKRRTYLALERRIAEHGKGLADIGLTSQQAYRRMRERWKDEAEISVSRVEQIAARYGYAFRETE